MIFPIVVGLGSWHACNEVHGFIHYDVNIYYVYCGIYDINIRIPHIASNIRVMCGIHYSTRCVILLSSPPPAYPLVVYRTECALNDPFCSME